MALRTNSKKVKDTIKNYIMENYNYICCDYDLQETDNYKTVCNEILNIFKSEYIHNNNRHKNRFELFFEWCSGLCNAIDTSYFYNVCAVDLLGGWLEETEEEKIRYSEAEAEKMITYLIFKELTKHGDYKIIL